MYVHVQVYVYICIVGWVCIHVCSSGCACVYLCVCVCSVSPLSHHLLVKMKVCISLRYEISFSWRRDLIG